MIKFIVISFYLLSLVVIPCAKAERQESKIITLRADRWYPFNGDPWDDNPGYMIEIAKKVFEEAGYKIDYQIIPWARAIEDTRVGKHDAIVGASVGDAPDFIYPTEPLGIVLNSFFTRSDFEWTYKDPSSLTRYRLGCIEEYSYGKILDKYIAENIDNPNALLMEGGYNPLANNIHKLRLKQIDIVPSTPQVFYAELEQMHLDRSLFRFAGSTPDKDPIHIAFSPNVERSRKLATILAEGIKNLRSTGELKKILDRYKIEDWRDQ